MQPQPASSAVGVERPAASKAIQIDPNCTALDQCDDNVGFSQLSGLRSTPFTFSGLPRKPRLRPQTTGAYIAFSTVYGIIYVKCKLEAFLEQE